MWPTSANWIVSGNPIWWRWVHVTWNSCCSLPSPLAPMPTQQLGCGACAVRPDFQRGKGWCEYLGWSSLPGGCPFSHWYPWGDVLVPWCEVALHPCWIRHGCVYLWPSNYSPGTSLNLGLSIWWGTVLWIATAALSFSPALPPPDGRVYPGMGRKELSQIEKRTSIFS